MAHQSRDYMQYLDGRYGFSPANSQEEMNAAQVISDALREHDLNTQVEEFSAPLWGKRLYFIPMLLLFVGVFLVIFPGPARIVGLRPENIALAAPTARGGLAARVDFVEPLGNETLVHVVLNAARFHAIVRAPGFADLRPGASVSLLPDLSKAVAF